MSRARVWPTLVNGWYEIVGGTVAGANVKLYCMDLGEPGRALYTYAEWRGGKPVGEPARFLRADDRMTYQGQPTSFHASDLRATTAPRGRPPGLNPERLAVDLRVPCTDAQKKKWNAAAEKRGVYLTEIIRDYLERMCEAPVVAKEAPGEAPTTVGRYRCGCGRVGLPGPGPWHHAECPAYVEQKTKND